METVLGFALTLEAIVVLEQINRLAPGALWFILGGSLLIFVVTGLETRSMTKEEMAPFIGSDPEDDA
jgi:hypothetical protein